MIIKSFNTDDWIRVSTAADIKGVKRQSIYYHIDNGKLTAVLIDDTVFVNKLQIEQLKVRRPNGSA